MKRSYIYISLLLAVTLAGSLACKTTETAKTNQPVNAARTGDTNADKPKGTDSYPEVPAALMNAEMKGLDGKTFKLKDHAGKTLLVNLWAIWCGPCRMEMPELVEIENDYKDKGVMVIGLDVDDEPEEDVKEFVEKQKLNYYIGWSGDEGKRGFVSMSRSESIPQSFIITADGRLAGIFKGYAPQRTNQAVRRALDEALSKSTQ